MILTKPIISEKAITTAPTITNIIVALPKLIDLEPDVDFTFLNGVCLGIGKDVSGSGGNEDGVVIGSGSGDNELRNNTGRDVEVDEVVTKVGENVPSVKALGASVETVGVDVS
eukprot:CAMPEP_0194291418 /NCGR_PEP_ID=MMETSP0169-20130528/43311_1 /TAXON_ID=218684 /ORGANISM="Corethron pennatum, Strain L29A3" /LENGTH=112 /DNA_ID=CAMNT_0039039287 /DNA_START=215 /DNA_END=553 /DNA_ORIENTATION=+